MKSNARRLLILALMAAPAGARCAPAAAPPGPNVIVIVIDALRADHMSLYGYGRKTTPNMDAFARGAAVFRQAVTQAPNTLLSFASLFTSLNVAAHGVTGQDRALGDAVLTLAESFRIYNYKTAAFVGGMNLHPVFRLDRGFDLYSHAARTDSSFRETLPAARAWAQQRLAGGEPFFLLVHGNDLHTPYAFPPSGLYDKGFKVSPQLLAMRETEANVFGAYKRRLLLGPGKGVLQLTDDDAAHLTARYDEGVRYSDGLVGGFLRWLRKSGLLDRSVVVILADHGEGLFDHDYFFHDFSLYDEVLRVPLLIRTPGGTGREVSRQVRLIDLMPTLLDLAGIPPPEQAQGRNLRPLLEGREPAAAEDSAVSQGAFGGVAIRSGGWKYALNGGKEELYDLRKDPGERRNLAASEPAQAAALKKSLLAELGSGAGGPPPERLRPGAAFPPGTAEDGAWHALLFQTMMNPVSLEPGTERP